MSDKPTIAAGVVIFVALATFPIWHGLGAAGDVGRPELELPEDQSECIEDTQYMRAHHEDLLNEWRNAVVRDGAREYSASSGEAYPMSLSGTCMDCHTSREAFCTRCHDYAGVEPGCWSCHVEPEGN